MNDWWDQLSQEQKERLSANNPELAAFWKEEQERQAIIDAAIVPLESYRSRVEELKKRLKKTRPVFPVVVLMAAATFIRFVS